MISDVILIVIKIEFMFMFICYLWSTMLHTLSVFMNCVFVIHFMNYISENNHWFSSFIHLIRADCEKWSSWNFFIKINIFFFIIMYDSHVLCLYSSYLIRNSNCMNFVFYFMLLIKLIKYKSSSFSTIMNCDNSTCLLIELSFKNHNRLTWNIE